MSYKAGCNKRLLFSAANGCYSLLLKMNALRENCLKTWISTSLTMFFYWQSFRKSEYVKFDYLMWHCVNLHTKLSPESLYVLCCTYFYITQLEILWISLKQHIKYIYSLPLLVDVWDREAECILGSPPREAVSLRSPPRPDCHNHPQTHILS